MNATDQLTAPAWRGTGNHRLIKILTVALLCLAVGYAILLAFEVVLQPLDIFDECIQILGGHAVGSGMTPHADFWTDYPALNYWILAASFKLFGSSYFVARFLSIAFYVLVLAVAWMVSSNWMSGSVLVVGLIAAIGRFYYYAPWNAFALVLVVVLLVYCKRRDNSSVYWLLIGCLLALCLLMRVNFGGYAFIAVASSILLSAEGNTRDKAIKLAWISAPMIVAVVVYAIVCRHNLPAVYAQLIDFPMHGLMLKRILRISPLAIVMLILPFFLVARHMWSNRRQLGWLLVSLVGLTGILLFDLHLRQGVPRPTYAVFAAVLWILLQAKFRTLRNDDFTVLLCYLLFVHYYFARADVFHIWPALLLLVLLGLLKITRVSITPVDRADLAIVIVMAVVVFLVQPSYHMLVLHQMPFSPYMMMRLSPQSHTNLRVELGVDDGEPEALDYLLRHTAAHDYVYSGLLDHSRGFTDNLRSYVILQRPIPVSDWEYEPGYSSEAPSQTISMRQLEQTHTNWLLLWHGYRDENALDRKSRGSTLLDSYIRDKFCPVEKRGDYEVWRRCSQNGLSPRE